ncbi:MAG TPA: HDOD domain-containing protein, partial [Bryobacteraceae bacterium]|nr:HDOD domain-containing protein [Bryobacteraceae bacterium]
MPEQGTVIELKGRLILGLDRLPPCSPILSKLLATIAREDVSFAQVATLIESDTVLAGNVLKVVNSALYGFRGTVNSVRHAVAILGVDRLRNLSLGFSVAR